MSMEDINGKMKMGYNESLSNSSRVSVISPIEETPVMVVRNNNTSNNVNDTVNISKGTFRECQKNHAVNNGGHSLEGCCEFLPAGPEDSIDALKCAACNCHRNFHRNEAPLPSTGVSVAAPVPTTVIRVGDAYPPYNSHRHQAAPLTKYMMYHVPKGLLHVTTAPPNDHDDPRDHDNGGIGSSSNSKKEKMKAFAERLDWRIQKQDDVVVQEFCNENGVKHQVLKVWMHNNKHTIGKKP